MPGLRLIRVTSGAAQTTVRIFPLAEVVLFPDTLLPLHIFEPRYRELLADSMASDRRIGMVLIRRPEAETGPEAEAETDADGGDEAEPTST